MLSILLGLPILSDQFDQSPHHFRIGLTSADAVDVALFFKQLADLVKRTPKLLPFGVGDAE